MGGAAKRGEAEGAGLGGSRRWGRVAPAKQQAVRLSQVAPQIA